MCWISLSQPLRPLRPPGLDPSRHKPRPHAHPFPHIAHHPRPYYPSFLSSTSTSSLLSSECSKDTSTCPSSTNPSSRPSAGMKERERRYVKLPATHTFTSPVYRVAVPTIPVPRIEIPIPEVPVSVPQRRIRRTGRLHGHDHHHHRVSSPPPPVPPIPPRFRIPPTPVQPTPSEPSHKHPPPSSSGGGGGGGSSLAGGHKRVRFESPLSNHGHSHRGRHRRPPFIVDPPLPTPSRDDEVHILPYPYPAKEYRTGLEHSRRVRRATRGALGEVRDRVEGEVEGGKRKGLRRVRGREGLNRGLGEYPPFGGLRSWL